MFNFKQIVKKLKLILSTELEGKKILNKDVAKALNIDYNYFKQRIHNNRIPYQEILLFCAKRKISINWLFFDQMPEALVKNTQNIIMLKFNSVLGSAGFGVANYNIEQIEIGVDSTLLNFLNSNYKYTELLSVQGESMQPIIQDGSIVFVDKSKMSINDSSIYAILIEDEVFIKKIEQNNDEYILKSINSQYQDIKTKELKIIGKVIGVLTKL